MKKSKRLDPIVLIASNKEREAAILLAKKNSILESRQTKLKELQQYLAEYRQRYTSQGVSGLTVRNMRDVFAFMHKLESAIEQQKQLVIASERELTEQKENWKALKLHMDSLQKIVERYKHQEIVEQDKKEQKEADDRMHQRKR